LFYKKTGPFAGAGSTKLTELILLKKLLAAKKQAPGKVVVNTIINLVIDFTG
jgi:hypothetical protein